MVDRLTTRVDELVLRVAPELRRRAEKATSWLDNLASTKVDEAQPIFRLQDVAWRQVAGTDAFEAAEPVVWPVYRCVVTSDLVLRDEATWDADLLAENLAAKASRALSAGVRDVLWHGAQAGVRYPTKAGTLEAYVDRLGGRAVLVVADDVPPELAAVVDDVKKIPTTWVLGKGYLRAAVSGPAVQLVEAAWQVGWDRVGDTRAQLVVSRTVRVVRRSQALRLVLKP